MEIGSVAHKYYLLNIRLPVNEKKKINVGIGEIKDIQLVVSEPNGSWQHGALEHWLRTLVCGHVYWKETLSHSWRLRVSIASPEKWKTYL